MSSPNLSIKTSERPTAVRAFRNGPGEEFQPSLGVVQGLSAILVPCRYLTSRLTIGYPSLTSKTSLQPTLLEAVRRPFPIID